MRGSKNPPNLSMGSVNILERLAQNKDESLSLFISRMAKFDRVFCDVMAGGNDYTIKLEVRGNRGKLIHCKVHFDETAYLAKGDKLNSANDLED